MDYQSEENTNEVIVKLLEKLEVTKPSIEEMLIEIAQSGLSIKLEDANVSFFEKHQAEAISSMWKVVRIAKILKKQNLNIDLNMPTTTLLVDKKRLH